MRAPGVLGFVAVICVTSLRPASGLEWISVGTDHVSFVGGTTNFVPWGFNYDRDTGGRLLEDYWDREWGTVEEDFQEMKQLGANVVRIHLQLGKFMSSPDQPKAESLDR